MEAKLSEIITALSSSDESDRIYAIEDLQEVTDPEIIPYLITALQDRSVRVREAVVDVLINMGGPVVAEATAALLNSEDVPLRNAAIEILEKLGCSALDVLEKYMHSPSADVRKFTIDTIGKLINQSIESNLPLFATHNDRLSEEGMDKAIAATKALGLRRDDWAINHLSDEGVAEAITAAKALGHGRDDWAIPFLSEHISEPSQSSWLQCNIITALSLIDRLSDEDVNVAGAAAEALGSARDDWTIPFLLRHIPGPSQSSWVQCSIVVALSRISSEKSLEALQQIDKTQLSDEALMFLEMAINGEVI